VAWDADCFTETVAPHIIAGYQYCRRFSLLRNARAYPQVPMHSSSLRRQLVLPYVLLVVFVSVAIAWVSYRAGAQAVARLTERVVLDLLDRIRSATEQHLAAASVALNAIDPVVPAAPQPFPEDAASIEARLWIASALTNAGSAFVYFGALDGGFLGVRRTGGEQAEVLVKQYGAGPRTVYAARQIGDRTRVLHSESFDPRSRLWFGAAIAAHGPVWSGIYEDFNTGEPTITLAKAVYHADRSLAGVVGTDLTLKALTVFMRGLQVSPSGVAFVVDAEGAMVATSGDEQPFRTSEGHVQRVRVDEMHTPLLREAYSRVAEWKRQGRAVPGRTWHVSSGDLEIAAVRVSDRAGLDWTIVVAAPRSDFMEGVARSVLQAAGIAGVCILIALVLGLSLLNRVLRDIRVLSEAARKVGDGEPLPQLNIVRSDELGQLARSFSAMEHNLRIDKLTAVFNRASLTAQIARLRRQLQLGADEQAVFALLFIDLDHFKQVNDQYGHAAGDRVLVTVAARLKESVRVSDVVARYGGDEFVVLLKGVTDVRDVQATLDKIREIVEQPVELEHATVAVGASIGWALFPEDGKDVDKLLKIADRRMYDTKRSRRA